MQEINSLSDELASLTGQAYAYCELFDFTNKDLTPELVLYCENKKILVKLDSLTISLLKCSIFGKDKKILVWDWKNLASYVLATTGKPFMVEGTIIDLKVIEYHIGRRMMPPKTAVEALNRLKDVISTGIWKEVKEIYENLYQPLITSVIPHLETTGIMNIDKGCLNYGYYEISGQENGRLKSSLEFKQGYVPHNLKPENKKSLKPRSLDEIFMLFDFRGCEVYVLAWLSQDKLLNELCELPDIYIGLYESIFEKKYENKNNREMAKKCFLPVIYGQSAFALSQSLGITPEEANQIISRLHTLFPAVFTFIEVSQKQFQENGYAKSLFGKRRLNFESGKELLQVRNFSVQSPAAIACLEKLTHLYFALKEKTDLAFTVHDGYAVYASKENWKTILRISSEVFLGESQLFPGLRLKVTCRAGRNLNELKSLKIPGV